jgi:hypothetical protein
MPMTTQQTAQLLLALALAAPVARAHPMPDVEGEGPPQQPVPPGEWSESKLYRFRIERIQPCGPGPQGALRGDTTWVGAFFSVEAKEERLFVSPRDLELRRGGVILTASFVNQPKLPGCKPLLAAKKLRAGDRISGFALFEVPQAFRVKTADPIVIHYRPTRWGGARKAEVPIPECLDACAKVWVRENPEDRPTRTKRARAKI